MAAKKTNLFAGTRKPVKPGVSASSGRWAAKQKAKVATAKKKVATAKTKPKSTVKRRPGRAPSSKGRLLNTSKKRPLRPNSNSSLY